jgi:RNA polymerase sigma-70 factor (ECF subfamily)
LLAAARSGDREALGALLLHCRPYLSQVVLRTAGRQPEVECDSALQEAAARAVAGLPSFCGETVEEFLVWLARIVRNLILDRLRRRAPLPLAEVSSCEPLVAGGSSPSSSLRRREQANQLMATLQRLPEQQQEVVRLRHFEGLPHAEVARRLNITSENARALWVRALRRLRKELEGDE